LNSLLVIIALVLVVLIIYFVIKKRKYNLKGLFGDGLAVDVIPGKIDREKSVLIADIESIIKSSEQLDKILNSSNEEGKLYEKILLDEQLISQIRKANSKEDIEKILRAWTKQKISESYTKAENSTPSNDSTKKEAQPNTSANEKKETPKKTKSAKKILRSKKTTSNNQSEKTNDNKKGEWAGKSKELYEEIESLLNSKNAEKLMEIVKKLSDNQIKTILNHYFESLEGSKFGAIIKKSKSPNDVTNLLKAETVNSLKLEYERIKNNAAYARRKGKNTKSEELALLSIPHKIKMFEATFDKKDFYRVRDALLLIEKNINEKINEAPPKKTENSVDLKTTNPIQKNEKQKEPKI